MGDGQLGAGGRLPGELSERHLAVQLRAAGVEAVGLGRETGCDRAFKRGCVLFKDSKMLYFDFCGKLNRK